MLVNEGLMAGLFLEPHAPTALSSITVEDASDYLESFETRIPGVVARVLASTVTSSGAMSWPHMRIYEADALTLSTKFLVSSSSHICNAQLFVGSVKAPSCSVVSNVLSNPSRYNAGNFELTTGTVAFSNVGAVATSRLQNPFEALLDYLRKFFVPGYGKELADRLQALANDVVEDYDGAIEISFVSTSNLVSFLQKNVRVRRPSLSATPNGTIVATWHSINQKKMTAHFLDDGNLKFFVSSPNPRHPEQLVRITGVTTADSFFETANLNAYDWIFQ